MIDPSGSRSGGSPGAPTYISTAISYPNGPPHIGHAYEAMAADAVARFHRLDGRDVLFSTGTDEHGLKMAQAAAREGVEPSALADRNSALFAAMCEALDVSHDRFVRTSSPEHAVSAQALWRRMAAAGDVYQGTYEGWYSVRDEAFYDEAETRAGEGGARLGPQGTPVEWQRETTYFFRLSAYQERLLAHYAANPGFVAPEARMNEVVSFVRSGLRDLSVSRSTLTWGVPVPGDPSHVMYVWVDALANYLTACGFPDEDAPAARYWPAALHVIGKDIVRFHAVYWPAFLMSAGLPLPARVHGHGFLFNRGEKMSKSVGNVVDPVAMARRYGPDALRYFLLREVPYGQDGSYSHEAIVARINADLANDLGNLAQRSLTMVARELGGRRPAPGPATPEDDALLAAAYAGVDRARAQVADLALHRAAEEVWEVVALANRYFAAQEPWRLKATDPARRDAVLAATLEALRVVALAAQPFVPRGAARLLDLLGIATDERSLAHATPARRPAAGAALPGPSPVFPRYLEAES